MSRVRGVPDLDEFWQHRDLDGTPKNSGLEELQRGNTLGNTGWTHQRKYLFQFELKEDYLKVWVNGLLELSLPPPKSLTQGRFGFYTFSQRGVVFSTADSVKAEGQSPYPLTEKSANRSSTSSGRSAPPAPTRSTYGVGNKQVDADLLTDSERRNNVMTTDRQDEVKRQQEERDRRKKQAEADNRRLEKHRERSAREAEKARKDIQEFNKAAERASQDVDRAVQDASKAADDFMQSIFGKK